MGEWVGLYQWSDIICEMNVAQIVSLANGGHKCKKKRVVTKISKNNHQVNLNNLKGQ